MWTIEQHEKQAAELDQKIEFKQVADIGDDEHFIVSHIWRPNFGTELVQLGDISEGPTISPVAFAIKNEEHARALIIKLEEAISEGWFNTKH